MTLWIDAQLPPAIAPWIREHFGIDTFAVRSLGLRDALDKKIFQAARAASAIIVTKDGDFLRLLDQYGPPPHVIWVRCGNTSNARLREILLATLAQALALLQAGEALVEIQDKRSSDQ
ncbi:MAG TPA: DUF5615 family PIN-like protein [Armatimonadota bacterium]|nr:DUF5615 family PIN-like protein [Armatimonadota bacterium]